MSPIRTRRKGGILRHGRVADDAKANCIMSKALAAVPVTLQASLMGVP